MKWGSKLWGAPWGSGLFFKGFNVNHTRIKRTTNIIAIRTDDFNPMSLIVDFEHTLPNNYYLRPEDIIYAIYLDRDFIKEFHELSNKFQLQSFDVTSVLEVFAHPHAGFKFIRKKEQPGNKIHIRFRGRNPDTSDVDKYEILWDKATGTYQEKIMGEIDSVTGVIKGRYIRTGLIAG